MMLLREVLYLVHSLEQCYEIDTNIIPILQKRMLRYQRLNNLSDNI